MQGLNVTLDWWQIKIEDAITRPAIRDIMDRCYGGSPQEQAAYCGLITRDPNYGTATQRYTITNVDMPLQNLSSYKVEGWDLGILYKLPETSIGQFTISPTAPTCPSGIRSRPKMHRWMAAPAVTSTRSVLAYPLQPVRRLVVRRFRRQLRLALQVGHDRRLPVRSGG